MLAHQQRFLIRPQRQRFARLPAECQRVGDQFPERLRVFGAKRGRMQRMNHAAAVVREQDVIQRFGFIAQLLKDPTKFVQQRGGKLLRLRVRLCAGFVEQLVMLRQARLVLFNRERAVLLPREQFVKGDRHVGNIAQFNGDDFPSLQANAAVFRPVFASARQMNRAADALLLAKAEQLEKRGVGQRPAHFRRAFTLLINPMQNAFDPRMHVMHIERFGNIFVCARLKASDC